MDLKSIKPVYLAVLTVVIISIAAALIWVEFAQPWEITYLGVINVHVTENERQEHLDAFIMHNAGVKDACEIMYFYDFHCSACQRLAPWLDDFRERYPEVLITSYEMHDDDSRVRLASAKEEYGISSPSVPSVFICGSVIEGVEAVQNMLEPMALSVYNLPIR